MKNFLIACGLLLLTLLLTVCNALAVCRRTEALLTIAEQDDPETLCTELRAADNFLSLTIHHGLLEQAQQAAEDMRAYHLTDDPHSAAAYQSAKAKLILILREMQEGEKISFFNIF